MVAGVPCAQGAPRAGQRTATVTQSAWRSWTRPPRTAGWGGVRAGFLEEAEARWSQTWGAKGRSLGWNKMEKPLQTEEAVPVKTAGTLDIARGLPMSCGPRQNWTVGRCVGRLSAPRPLSASKAPTAACPASFLPNPEPEPSGSR